MRTPIIFPDGELALRDSLLAALVAAGETDIRVATQKTTPQQGKALKQVIIRSDGGTVYERILKEEDFGINIYVNMSNKSDAYAEANRLGSVLEAVLPVLPQIKYSGIKEIQINASSSPIVVDGEEQQRYTTITATILGTKFNF